MKKKFKIIITSLVAFGSFVFASCSNDTNSSENSEHTHTFTNYINDNNATCTKNATETAKCDGCDETNTREIVDSKAEHVFTNYVINNDATLEKVGTKTAKCDNCDEHSTIDDLDSKKVVENYQLADNVLYSGLLLNYKAEGNGTLKYIDSECVYTGNFKDGKFEGEGTFIWPSGWKYVGEFKDGKATYGTTTKPNGNYGLVSYTGYMNDLLSIDNTKLGTGSYLFDNGCNYNGQMYASGANETCLYHGEGTFKWGLTDNVWVFTGQFKDGKATYGKTVTAGRKDGLIWYEGAMNDLNSIKESELGKGYFVYENTMSYEGQMYAKNALEQYSVTFHGQGTFNWTTYNADGSVKTYGNRYEGQFSNGGATNLNGTMTYARALDGQNTAGIYYFTGKMEELGKAASNQVGQGKIVYVDGSYYIGEVKIDESYNFIATGTGKNYDANGNEK